MVAGLASGAVARIEYSPGVNRRDSVAPDSRYMVAGVGPVNVTVTPRLA